MTFPLIKPYFSDISISFFALSSGAETSGDNFFSIIDHFNNVKSVIRTVGESADRGIFIGKNNSYSDTKLILRTSGMTQNPAFTLSAGDGTNVKSLVGKPDGTLTWNGNDVITSAGGTINSYLTLNATLFFGGDNVSIRRSGGDNNRSITIFGKDGNFNKSLLSIAEDGNNFSLQAGDGTTKKVLAGVSNGTLTWNGKNVERVNASGTNYIRYESGFQICWAVVGNVTSTMQTVTFPVAFNSAPTVFSAGSANYTAWASGVSTTSCSVGISSGTNTVKYLAIGYWK